MINKTDVDQLLHFFWGYIEEAKNRIDLLVNAKLILDYPTKEIPVSIEKSIIFQCQDNNKLHDLWEGAMSFVPETRRKNNPFPKTETGNQENVPVEFPEDETVLETFLGFMHSIENNIAYLEFASRFNGDPFYGEYPVDKFDEPVDEKRQFLIQTIKNPKETRVEITLIPRRIITDEEAQAIKEEIDELFPVD